VKDNMEEKDFIKDLFHDKLSNLETPVRPELWSAVSSSIVSSSASTGLSLISKLIIGTSLTAAVSAGIWFAVSDSKNDVKPEKEPLKIEKKSTIENKEDRQNNDVSDSKISDVQLKTEVDKFILLPPQIESKSENNQNDLNLNSINAISEYKGQISEEKQDLQPIIEQKSDSKVENSISNQKLDSKPAPIESEVKINLPNVFTPNGDGSNDFLSISNNDLDDFSVVVLDNNGKTIFTSTETDFRWDGRLTNGDLAPSGNYVYFITAKDKNGKPVTRYSSLSIRY
jgi:gliding motility-associated-like protein